MISLYRFFIFPSFNSIFTMFMQISFLPIYKKYFLLVAHLYQQKKKRKNTKKSLPFKQSCCHPNLPSSSSFLHRSETIQFTIPCLQTSINTGFLNIVPTFIHNHFLPLKTLILLLIPLLFPLNQKFCCPLPLPCKTAIIP